MKVFYSSPVSPSKRVVDVPGDTLRIGRAEDNDLVLNSPFVALQSVLLTRGDAGWEAVALAHSPVTVGSRSLSRGDRQRIASGDVLRLPPYTLEFDIPDNDDPEAAILARLDGEVQDFTQALHAEVLRRVPREFLNLRTPDGAVNVESIKRWEDEIDRTAGELGLPGDRRAALVDHLAGLAILDVLVELVSSQVDGKTQTDEAGLLARDRPWSRMVTATVDRVRETESTATHIGSAIGLDATTDVSTKLDLVERKGLERWHAVKTTYHAGFRLDLAKRYLKKQIKDLVFGYGPLEDLLALPTISEIMVVRSDRIYVEKNGRVQNSGRRFLSDEVTEDIIGKIVEKVGRTIDRSRPMVDARLRDGSRVNAVIAPIAASGPCLTIRKFPSKRISIDDLVQKGAMTSALKSFLGAAVAHRCNIVVSGGTGTGKTTLLNCLSDFISEGERVVTVEDTVELQVRKSHVVQMESKPANIEGKGAYTIGDLVRNALRMRPDRIVVGECRGAEALDMLQAMNTGHDGSLTTIHANTAADVILRLEVMVQMARDLPTSSIHRQIASAIDLVVQLTRMRDGRRVVSQVAEVVGLDEDTGKVRLRDLFLLVEDGTRVSARPTGPLPSFMHDLIRKQLIDLDIFYDTPPPPHVAVDS